MSILLKPLEEQLHLASTTKDEELLWELHLSPYMNVRRSVARNSSINTKTANRLIVDPVYNVSYMAKLSCKAQKDRNFKTEATKCVLCDKDELNLNCLECEESMENIFSK